MQTAILIDGFVHFAIFVKECEAEVAVSLLQKSRGEAGAAAEELVELGVAKADFGVVFEGAAIVDFADVGPEDGGEAHWARLAGGVELATRQIVGLELLLGLSDGVDFAVAGRVGVF